MAGESMAAIIASLTRSSALATAACSRSAASAALRAVTSTTVPS